MCICPFMDPGSGLPCAMAPPVQCPSPLLDMFKCVQLAQLGSHCKGNPIHFQTLSLCSTNCWQVVTLAFDWNAFLSPIHLLFSQFKTFFLVISCLLFSFPSIFPNFLLYSLFPFVSVSSPKLEFNFDILKSILFWISVTGTDPLVLLSWVDVSLLEVLGWLAWVSLHLELLTFHPVRNKEPQFVFPDKVAMEKKVCRIRMVLRKKLWGCEFFENLTLQNLQETL